MQFKYTELIKGAMPGTCHSTYTDAKIRTSTCFLQVVDHLANSKKFHIPALQSRVTTTDLAWSVRDLHVVQVLTTSDDFALVRERVMQLGLAVDHDSSGLVFSPFANVEVGGL